MSLNDRKQIYSQVHINAKQLNLSETARRGVYKALTGQRTLVDMRPTELAIVADFFKSQVQPVKHEALCSCDDCCLELLA